MRRKFYLHRRNGIYYAEIFDISGKKLAARSTGEQDRDSAAAVVGQWLREGIPTGRRRQVRDIDAVFGLKTILSAIQKTDLTRDEAVRITEELRKKGLIDFTVIKTGGIAAEEVGSFLTRFWTFESSPYIAEKRAHGQRIGKRHAYESLNRVKRYWVSAFPGKKVGELIRIDLKTFSLELSQKSLSANSINKILICGTTAFRWLYQNGYIPEDPTAGLKKFSGVTKARDILSPKEAAALFKLKWTDERARIASLLSATTGLREGEVLGLQLEDIGLDRIFVRHSWSPKDGLKGTKTGIERTVPLLPTVRKELLTLIDTRPIESTFIFYSSLANKPSDQHVLIDGLNNALICLSIGDEKDPEKRKKALTAWRERGICFHSWRHFYARQIADRVDVRTAKLGTGHSSDVMLEHYANHRLEEDFTKLAAGAENAFGSIVDFQTQEV